MKTALVLLLLLSGCTFQAGVQPLGGSGDEKKIEAVLHVLKQHREALEKLAAVVRDHEQRLPAPKKGAKKK